MFVQSIGGPAAAKVIRADIYPIKVPDVTEAVDQLKEFQKVFDAPPPCSQALGVLLRTGQVYSWRGLLRKHPSTGSG
jgi:hypothetical protein